MASHPRAPDLTPACSEPGGGVHTSAALPAAQRAGTPPASYLRKRGAAGSIFFLPQPQRGWVLREGDGCQARGDELVVASENVGVLIQMGFPCSGRIKNTQIKP